MAIVFAFAGQVIVHGSRVAIWTAASSSWSEAFAWRVRAQMVNCALIAGRREPPILVVVVVVVVTVVVEVSCWKGGR